MGTKNDIKWFEKILKGLSKVIVTEFLTATTAAAVLPSVAAPLGLEDYCDVKISAPKSVKEMTPLADGQSYACISDDGNSIDVYSYKTGQKTSTLFSISNIAGSVKIDEFDGFAISENGKSLLLWNNVDLHTSPTRRMLLLSHIAVSSVLCVLLWER